MIKIFKISGTHIDVIYAIYSLFNPTHLFSLENHFPAPSFHSYAWNKYGVHKCLCQYIHVKICWCTHTEMPPGYIFRVVLLALRACAFLTLEANANLFPKGIAPISSGYTFMVIFDIVKVYTFFYSLIRSTIFILIFIYMYTVSVKVEHIFLFLLFIPISSRKISPCLLTICLWFVWDDSMDILRPFIDRWKFFLYVVELFFSVHGCYFNFFQVDCWWKTS